MKIFDFAAAVKNKPNQTQPVVSAVESIYSELVESTCSELVEPIANQPPHFQNFRQKHLFFDFFIFFPLFSAAVFTLFKSVFICVNPCLIIFLCLCVFVALKCLD
jgi:hypothetical protein